PGRTLTAAPHGLSPSQWRPMNLPQAAKARLAIDVGGTFTDVVLDRNGQRGTTKVLTTHDAPEQGVIGGVEAGLNGAGVRPDNVDFIIHGTTLATNALIERKGARTALLTTEGFRDTIELGTESRFDQYDVNLVKQAPLVPRNWRIPIVERVAADGEILCPLDEASALDAISRLRAESIESVAVAFLHSYVQPVHMRDVCGLKSSIIAFSKRQWHPVTYSSDRDGRNRG